MYVTRILVLPGCITLYPFLVVLRVVPLENSLWSFVQALYYQTIIRNFTRHSLVVLFAVVVGSLLCVCATSRPMRPRRPCRPVTRICVSLRQYSPVWRDIAPSLPIACSTPCYVAAVDWYRVVADLGGGSTMTSISLDGLDIIVFDGLYNMAVSNFDRLVYVDCVDREGLAAFPPSRGYVHLSGIDRKLIGRMKVHTLRKVLQAHGVRCPSRCLKAKLTELAMKHKCLSCRSLCLVYMGRPQPDLDDVEGSSATPCQMLAKKGFTLVDYVGRDDLRWYEPSQGYLRCEVDAEDLVLTFTSDVIKDLLVKRDVIFEDECRIPTVIRTHPSLRYAVFLIPTRVQQQQSTISTPSVRHSRGPEGLAHSPRSHKLVDYGPVTKVQHYAKRPPYEIEQVTLVDLVEFLDRDMAISVARLHGIALPATRKPNIGHVQQLLKSHACSCQPFLAVFQPKSVVFTHVTVAHKEEPSTPVVSEKPAYADDFPPPPPDKALMERIVRNFCDAMSVGTLTERGCAVCGLLTPESQLSPLKAILNYLSVLESSNIMVKERKHPSSKPTTVDAPVLDNTCDGVCDSCRSSLRRGRVPRFALSRGTWIGSVPEELRVLRTVEKMLISKVRHNYCVATVASGHRKLKCNVVCFEMPVQKVYEALPPPVEDISEVLAIIFSGPTYPTDKEFSRTPFLVRRREVRTALEWLKLNHSDYANIEISDCNLNRYPESVPPVDVVYKRKDTNKNNVDPGPFEDDEEDGVETGDCPFAVHGLTGDDISHLTGKEMKGLAISHWNAGEGVLRVGQSDTPEKTYKNPKLYPSMFPWLFPYGRGGIGSVHLSPSTHKRLLLMYHDKRFQLDEYFCLVAFNHEQYDETSRNGFLIGRRPAFKQIMKRLLHLDREVLAGLGERMARGEALSAFDATSPEEKACFALLNDLDHVSGKTYGSLSSKKWMRNELWSMIAFKGAPLWYITINPVDVKHPVCMYYAGSSPTYDPTVVLPYEDRVRLAAKNPVGCARFFDFIVTQFVQHVLGTANDQIGLYGETSGYYGVVEQQGRLSLHLHLLLWVKGGSNPEDVRKRLTDPTSDFSKRLVEYLESIHRGEFFQGDMDTVAATIAREKAEGRFVDPIVSLPEPPPVPCDDRCDSCASCESNQSWWSRFRSVVDKIVYLSNRHVCRSSFTKSGKWKRNVDAPGCLDNPYKRCKRRFPRMVRKHTVVNTETGSMDMRHLEAWLNTFVPILSYLVTCNTDATNLRSGTAVKAVLLYVSNYITKVSLKTYVVFDIIKTVFQKADAYLRGPSKEEEKTRTLLVKMVNAMSAKLEIGSPMAALYLLRGSDKYTDHEFASFYWQGFVHETAVSSGIPIDFEDVLQPERVPILSKSGKLSFRSRVDDYINRSLELEDMCLYEWTSRCTTSKIPRSKCVGNIPSSESSCSDASEDDSGEISGCDGRDVQALHHRKWTGTRRLRMLPSYRDSKEYWTSCVPYAKRRIPNILGRSVPRKDKGNRDYYCLTMLTFFVPWRTGRDIAGSNSTWQEAFEGATFTGENIEFMRNFHVRYECIDAKDDYFAQMKKGGPVTVDLPIDPDDEDELDGLDGNGKTLIDNILDDELFDPIDYDGSTSLLGQGQKDARRLKRMAKMSDFLDKTGWTTCIKRDQPVDLGQSGQDPESDSDAEDSESDDDSPITVASDCLVGWRRRLSDAREHEMERRTLLAQGNRSSARSSTNHRVFKGVDVVNKSFMQRRLGLKITEEDKIILDIKVDEGLNEEQERAFTIIAQHAITPGSAQLRMYIGGVGGTGKSTVIRAVQALFEKRGEQHRCLIVAPTGNAAALLGGSTYHYALGLAPQRRDSGTRTLGGVRDRLNGVDYIILDEVSMLSCRDLERIHRRLGEVTGSKLMPFGGINLILCGDFAQLPPVAGYQDGALYSRVAGLDGSRIVGQEAACGKALWQQIYAVVILRKNMRQRESSTEDDRFRRALGNMRYKSCDALDLAFLRSRRYSPNMPGNFGSNGFPAKFRNVSVITARHVDIDVLNEIGCRRYAAELGKPVHRFYSDDEIPFDEESATTTGRRTSAGSNARVRTQVTDDMDFVWRALWDQPPSANSENIPGHIDVFTGMPVIIQRNSATELGVTKGQEAKVTGWIEGSGRLGQPILEVLFVKLSKPFRTVRVDGLPKNVVPLTHMRTLTTVSLPDDTIVRAIRSQSEVVPNFGMTDFQSQGKTRGKNSVHLKNLRDHMSYYTALSRGTSAAGTLILDDFDAAKITGGELHAGLKQEFRELELLDEITRLRFTDELSNGVCAGMDRVSLINEYRNIKGNDYVPETVHPAIRWSPTNPYLDFTHVDVSWQKRKRQGGETSLDMDEAVQPQSGKSKKQKRAPAARTLPNGNVQSAFHPVGPKWSENSCAYDAVACILRNCWFDIVIRPGERLTALFPNFYTSHLLFLVDRFKEGNGLYDGVRDMLRRRLEADQPDLFVCNRFASVVDVLKSLLRTSVPVYEITVNCMVCRHAAPSRRLIASAHTVAIPLQGHSETLSDIVNGGLGSSFRFCQTCHNFLSATVSFKRAPPLLSFDVSQQKPIFSEDLNLRVEGVGVVRYVLKGAIYYGASHFTSRFKSSDSEIWFHDGLTTGHHLLLEASSTVDWSRRGSTSVSALVYVKASA